MCQRNKLGDREAGASLVEAMLAVGLLSVVIASATAFFTHVQSAMAVEEARSNAIQERDNLMNDVSHRFMASTANPTITTTSTSLTVTIANTNPQSPTQGTMTYKTSCVATATLPGLKNVDFTGVAMPCTPPAVNVVNAGCAAGHRPVVVATWTPKTGAVATQTYPHYNGKGTGTGGSTASAVAASLCAVSVTSGGINSWVFSVATAVLTSSKTVTVFRSQKTLTKQATTSNDVLQINY